MNNKGISKISVIFFSLVFLIIWGMFIAPLLSTYGQLAITNGSLGGIEALLYGNINLIVAFVFFVFVLAVGSVAE